MYLWGYLWDRSYLLDITAVVGTVCDSMARGVHSTGHPAHPQYTVGDHRELKPDWRREGFYCEGTAKIWKDERGMWRRWKTAQIFVLSVPFRRCWTADADNKEGWWTSEQVRSVKIVKMRDWIYECLTCGGDSSDRFAGILIIESVNSDRVVCFWQ